MRVALAGALTALALTLGACGGEDEAPTTTTGPVATTTIPDEGPPIKEAPDEEGGKGEKPGGGGEDEPPKIAAEDGTPGGDPGGVAAQDEANVETARQTYERYVAAINDRDGAELCELLDPDFTDELELPVKGGGCAQQLSRSIGYRDPRGTPVWKETFLSGTESALLRKGENIQLSTAIVTKFRSSSEASVESDIAYLYPARGGEGYVLAKAPGSLWRAVGKPDVPPSVITPPKGF